MLLLVPLALVALYCTDAAVVAMKYEATAAMTLMS